MLCAICLIGGVMDYVNYVVSLSLSLPFPLSPSTCVSLLLSLSLSLPLSKGSARNTGAAAADGGRSESRMDLGPERAF